MSRTYEVLTTAERRILRQVRTTRKQAESIKARNEALLEILLSFQAMGPSDKTQGTSQTVNMGCPHCMGCNGRRGFPSGCAWNIPALRKAARADPDNFGDMLYCTHATFGGVSAKKAKFISYAPTWAMVTFSGYPFTPFDEGIREAKQFVKGHIEWADAILEGRWKRRRKGSSA